MPIEWIRLSAALMASEISQKEYWEYIALNHKEW